MLTDDKDTQSWMRRIASPEALPTVLTADFSFDTQVDDSEAIQVGESRTGWAPGN